MYSQAQLNKVARQLNERPQRFWQLFVVCDTAALIAYARLESVF
jgi:hypothetical protein